MNLKQEIDKGSGNEAGEGFLEKEGVKNIRSLLRRLLKDLMGK
jgi:hypothetical protein